MMLKQFSIQDGNDMAKWDNFVVAHPAGTPFHLSCWLKVIHETYSFEPKLYAYYNTDGGLAGLFPCFFVRGLWGKVKGVSIPFSDYGGPLFDVPKAEASAFKAILETKSGKQLNCLEVRSHLHTCPGFVCHNHYKRHVIDLRYGIEEVKKKINKKTIQYSIRKALRSGIEIREDNTEAGMKIFAHLNFLTRKKHGMPSQPDTFFEKIFEYTVSKGVGSLLIALADSRPVAAGFFLYAGNSVYYKYNASDPYFLSKVTPNHLLTWTAIQRACERSFRYFDLGRTSPSNKGLMRHKRMWGSEELDLAYHFFPSIKGATAQEGEGKAYRLFTSFWGRLPDRAARIFGPILYRYFA